MNALPAIGLLTVDSPIGLTVMRELGQRGVPVIAIGKTPQSLGRNSRHAAKFVTRPDGPIADWLEDFAAQHGFARLMAVSEGDLLQLSELKQRADYPVELAVPNADTLQLVLDKNEIAEVAQKQGIRVPRTWSPTSSDPSEISDLTFPVAIKWADPNAVVPLLAEQNIEFVKVEYASDETQLQAALQRHDAIVRYPIVQEYCPGFGLGQMFHMHGGHATLRFQHQRLREWPLSGGVSSYCAALPPDAYPELMAGSEVLLKAIDWDGPAMVEYKVDPATGTAWLMEINGRFWGSQPLASAAGAHFGWETYRHAFLPGQEPNGDSQWKLRRARYAAPELKNLVDVIRSDWPLGRKLGFVAKFFAAYLDPRISWYVWSWRDPAPFLYELRHSLSRFLRRES